MATSCEMQQINSLILCIFKLRTFSVQDNVTMKTEEEFGFTSIDHDYKSVENTICGKYVYCT